MCPAAPSRRLAARCVTPRRSVLVLAAISALCLSVPVLADSTISTIERVKGSVVAVGTFERTRVPAFQFRATGFAVGDGSLIATNAHALPPTLDSERRESLAILIPPSDREPQIREAAEPAVTVGTDPAVLMSSGP